MPEMHFSLSHLSIGGWIV